MEEYASLKSKFDSGVDMLKCPSKHKARFICISKSCCSASPSLLCIQENCPSCSFKKDTRYQNQFQVNRKCKKDQLILLQSFAEVISKKIKPLSKQSKNLLNETLGNLSDLIDQLSDLRQKLQEQSKLIECSPDEKNIVGIILLGENTDSIDHRIARKIKQKRNNQFKFQIQKVLDRINSILRPLQQGLVYCRINKADYTQMTFSQNRQYDLRSYSQNKQRDIINKLSKSACCLKISDSNSLRYQKNLMFPQVKKLYLHRYSQNTDKIIKNTFPNLTEIYIEEFESNQCLTQALQIPDLRKVCRQSDIQKSLSQIFYNQVFQNIKKSKFKIFGLNVSTIHYKRFQYWEHIIGFFPNQRFQLLRNLKHLFLRGQFNRLLMSDVHDIFTSFRYTHLHSQLISLSISDLYFDSKFSSFWKKITKLSKLSLTECHKFEERDLLAISQSFPQLQHFSFKGYTKQIHKINYQFLTKFTNLKELSLQIVAIKCVNARNETNQQQIPGNVIQRTKSSNISHLKDLQFLQLRALNINNDWLYEITKLQNIHSLYLELPSQTGYWNSSIKKIYKMQKLKTLVLFCNSNQYSSFGKIIKNLKGDFSTLKVVNSNTNVCFRQQLIKILAQNCKKIKNLHIKILQQAAWTSKIAKYFRSFRKLQQIHLDQAIKDANNRKIVKELQQNGLQVIYSAKNESHDDFEFDIVSSQGSQFEQMDQQVDLSNSEQSEAIQSDNQRAIQRGRRQTIMQQEWRYADQEPF